MRVGGKVALVTGAASDPGLGRAMALALRHDVTSEPGWQDAIARALDAFGGLDVLVNNAGIAVLKPLEALTLAEWNRQIEVNLTSVFLGCKHAAPAMRRSGGGSIINVSSVAGLVGLRTAVAYGAAKGGVRIATKSIAIELARDGIRCNSVHPGFIWTNMQAQAMGTRDPASVQLGRDRVPLGGLGEPQDVAECVVYLASDAAKYVTGAELVVDGGMTAQ